MIDLSSIEEGVWAAEETEFSSAVMSLNAAEGAEGAEASPRRVVLDSKGSLASSTEEDVVFIVSTRFTSASSSSSTAVELLLQKGESSTRPSASSALLPGITYAL